MSELAISFQEQNLLNICIHAPEKLAYVKDIFFLSKIGKDIFNTLKELKEKDLEFSVRNIVMIGNTLNSSIDELKIRNLFELNVATTDFDSVYKELRKSKAKEEIRTRIVRDILEHTTSKNSLDLDAIERLRNDLTYQLTQIKSNEDIILTPQMVMNDYMENINRRRDGSFFHTTGDHYLDSLLVTGFEPGYFYVLAARSGEGKTTTSLHIFNQRINKHLPTNFVTTELSRITIIDKLVSKRLRIPMTMLYPKSMDDSIPDHIIELIESERQKFLKSNKYRIIDTAGLWLKDIRQIIQQTQEEYGVKNVLTIIDLLTLLRDFSGNNKASTYEDAVNEIQDIVKSTESSILGVVQLKRPGGKIKIETLEDLEMLRPGIEEIKNSGAIEERARIVFSLFRPMFWAKKYLPPESPLFDELEDVAEIMVQKQNLGEVGVSVKYLFEGELNSLSKYIPPEDADEMDMSDFNEPIDEGV